MPLPEKTAMAISATANQETFREISNLFGVNRENSQICIFQILKAIGVQLKPDYVKWPSSSECCRTAQILKNLLGFPG